MALHGFVFAALLCCLHSVEGDMGDINVVVANKESDRASSLYRLNLTSNSVQMVDTFKLVRPTAIAVDDVTGRIYWSDVVTKEIRSSQLDGSDERSFVSFNTESIVDGIAVDSMERVLFFTDRGNKYIGSVAMDRPTIAPIVQALDDLPRAITVYSEKRLIFWTDWGVEAHIYSCSYSGDNKTTVVEVNIKWPNGLTIDTTMERLYWVDAFFKSIEGVNIDGSDRKRLATTGYHYYGIAFFEGALYTTDWDSNAVKVTALNGSELASIRSDFSKLSGLAVIRVPRGECEDGQYGLGCYSECGQCADDEVCDKSTGQCPSGCSTGWYSERCNRPDISILNSGTSMQGHLVFLLLGLAVTIVTGGITSSTLPV